MKTKILKFFSLIIVSVIVVLFLNGSQYKNEIANNKKQTICKFIYCKKYPKTTEGNFKYYVDKKMYKNRFGKCPDNYEQSLNKFYLMYYSAIDPNKIEVDFSKEIIDTTTIINAGFSRNDLLIK